MNKNKEVVFLVLIFFASECCGDDYILQINQGLLNGTVKYNRKNGIFFSFQSIPFAKPPMGELRFKEPQPSDNWDGILDATEDLPHCFQEDYSGNVIGEEDCLYLNVYTPQYPSDNYENLLDVMVFIYGGGFEENAGRQDLYSPEYLLTEDIILVTINYRVGIFGSFNLEDSTLGYPGNLQMKDQVLALKWVQSNIDRFGGNPGSVTIFGESAGGASVHYHVLSPLSAGTFHRAIMESGTALGPWAVGVPNNGMLLAETLNIETANASQMINELLSITGEEIFAGQQKLIADLNLRWGGIGFPVLETEVNGQSAFLTDEPLSIIQSGQYNDVPMIIGYNNAEGILFASGFSDLYGLIPGDLNIEENSDKAEELIEEMEQFYYGGGDLTTENIIQMYTDIWFAFPAYRVAMEHKKTTYTPIYFYRFSADTSLNVYKLSYDYLRGYAGATHADELGYLFKTHFYENITQEIVPDSVEDKAIDRIVTLWTNFAKYGEPTPETFTDFQWLPITDDTFNYIEFGTNETIPSVDPDPENIKFWLDVYEKYY